MSGFWRENLQVEPVFLDIIILFRHQIIDGEHAFAIAMGKKTDLL